MKGLASCEAFRLWPAPKYASRHGDRRAGGRRQGERQAALRTQGKVRETGSLQIIAILANNLNRLDPDAEAHR